MNGTMNSALSAANQSPDLNPAEMLGQNFLLGNPQMWPVAPYCKHLIAVVTAKGGSNRYYVLSFYISQLRPPTGLWRF